MSDAVLPDRPLDRFLAVQDALVSEKKWTDDPSALRYAASTLILHEGSPARVASHLRRVAARLVGRAGWFGPMQSSVRFAVAAMLLRSDDDADGFCDDVERLTPLFKEAGLRGAGNTLAVLAMLLLRQHALRAGRTVGVTEVQRVRDVHDEMKQHHRFLTGSDDYPAAALLACTDASPGEIGRRVEVFYEGLRDLGFKRGNALQTVSHILFFAPAADDLCMRRFRALWGAFDEAGLWMNVGDYDEVAVLSFLSQPAGTVVATVLEHRERLARHPPKPGKELGFSLACGTAFLQLVKFDEGIEGLHQARNVLQVQAILQAQQVAAIAAMAAASAAAASSS